MTERTVKVTLTSQVAGYISGMEQARKKTGDFSDEAKKKLEEQGRAFTSLGSTALKFGAVAGAGIALAIAKFAEFDQAMSNVQAALQVSAKDLGLLRAAAIDAGAKTVYSATQAAQAIEELGKNGLTTSEILNGGLAGALNLATSGQLDVARAAEVAAVSMKQFALNGSDVPHIADLLAAGAGKAAGDVEDLAQALAQGGLVAHQSGLTIEETTGVLAAFADQGLKGSDAGTSLKSALQALTPTSQKASEEMKKLGISAYDSSGNFIGAAALAGNLQDKLKGLTPEARNSAEAIIFGSDAVRSASVLYTLGASGIQKYIDQTNDSGYAAKVAADRMNNLSGDIEQLKGSIDTALIQTGSGANDTLRKLTQNVTFLVNVFGSLPTPVTDAGLAIAVAGTSVLLLGGGAIVAVPKIAAFGATLKAAGVSGRTAAAGLGVASGAVAAATLVIGYFISEAADAAATTDSLTDSLDKTTGALTTYSRAIVAKKLADSGAFEAAKNAGVGQKELTDAILNGGTALDGVLSKLQGQNTIASFFWNAPATIAVGNATDTINSLRQSVVDSKADFDNVAASGANVTDTNAQLSDSYTDVKDAVDGVVTSVQDLSKELDAQNQTSLDARAAARDLESAYDDFDKGLKKNGQTLDIHTEKGRANQANLDAIAAAALKSGDAIAANGGSYEDYSNALTKSRHSLLERINDLGVHGKAARDLANDILDIPTKREFDLIANTDAAQHRVSDFISKNNGKSIKIRVDAETGTTSYTLNRVILKAAGGAISGPGSGTSDDVPILASNGEHVLTAAEVSRAGGQGAVYAARARLMATGRLAFANGGAVTTASMVEDVKDARQDERDAQARYDKIKSSEKEAKKRAQVALDAAKKAVTDAEKTLADRREADAALTKTYAKNIAEQSRDQKFLGTQAKAQDGTAAGQALAKKYNDEATDAMLTNAQNNVQSLRDIIADPKASKTAKAKAKKALDKQIADLNDLQLKQIQEGIDATAADAADAAAKAAADAAQAAADALADAIRNIADQFDSIDLSGLSDQVQTFKTVVNADGSTSIFGSTSAGTPTAQNISDYFGKQDADDQRFAAKLQQLAGNIPAGLLQYITSLGVAKGEPYADALLAGSATTIASITANYNAAQASANAIGGIVAPLIGHADGGAVYGPGTGRSDSVPRMLSNGEHVLTAAEVAALGGHGAVYAMRAGWRSGSASPGTSVQYAPSTSTVTNISFHVEQHSPVQMTTDQMANAILSAAGSPAL